MAVSLQRIRLNTEHAAEWEFSEVLPPELAVGTIAERLADRIGASAAASEARVWSALE